LEKAQSIMCIHAEQDQPRPKRCRELHAPCEECAAEEQRKMDELGDERIQKQRTMRISISTCYDLTLLERTELS
jgi:hypothetical protein